MRKDAALQGAKARDFFGKDEIIKNQRLKTFPQFSDEVKALNSTKSSWKSREGNGEGKEIGERREKGE